MSSRLRIFVKKRGSRRTGSRWQALLAASVGDASLIIIGCYGIYWLARNYLLADGASDGWWPWIVLLVPIALVVYGTTGLIASAWQHYVSSERRAATVQKATDWEIPGTDVRPAFRTLPTVPAIEPVVESPGVRLANRLPIDAASGWVVASMAVICLAWNTFVAVFVVQVIRLHLAGSQAESQPKWLLTWLMVPFVMAGIWTLVALGRTALLWAAIGPTRVEVSDHPFFPDKEYRCFVSQSGRLHVRWFQVLLVCQEQATYQQGTDTRVDTADVHRDIVFSRRKFDITPGEAFETEISFSIPASAMHSFVTTHNAVHWAVLVKGRTRSWGEFERRFPIFVYPSAAALAPTRTELRSQARSHA